MDGMMIDVVDEEPEAFEASPSRHLEPSQVDKASRQHSASHIEQVSIPTEQAIEDGVELAP